MNRLIYLLAALFCVAMVSCSKAPAGSHLDVDDPEGSLEVSETHVTVPEVSNGVKIWVTYKNSKGLYEPMAITIEPYVQGIIDGNHMIYTLREAGTYTLKAGQRSVVVYVTLAGE